MNDFVQVLIAGTNSPSFYILMVLVIGILLVYPDLQALQMLNWCLIPRERRARELLLNNLTSTQKEELSSSGYFFVQGGQSGLRYRVGPGDTVLLMDGGSQLIGSFCVSPEGKLPTGDVMLAHALSIQHDERRFCSVAVFFPQSKDLWYRIIPILRSTNMLFGTNYQNFMYYV